MNLHKIAILLSKPQGQHSKAGPFDYDQNLNDLAQTKDMDEFYNTADSTCTTGYDNDGSTGFEIFKNGFELAKQANGPIWVIQRDDRDVAFFYVGTFDEVWNKISKLLDAS
jgi:hypothetical protein